MSPPVGPFTPMPAPALPDPADGFDAFDDSVRQAGANFTQVKTWSDPIYNTIYNGQAFGPADVTMSANWTITNGNKFSAYKLGHIITIDALFQCAVALVFGADCHLATPSQVCTLPPALRPLSNYVASVRAVLNSYAASVIIQPAGTVTVYSIGVPSQTPSYPSTLYLHAQYNDQYYDSQITP